eukprot:gnl/MRDRNA2_/MRDRNA2_92449_c0_seq1.p1 gnl/MRDRNA2_/MRDRNA2_92449_c0~~gnl/MRDRNA2_/MRDRNA2_92449_c0_seq1.p1  ORF type:complete len:752 (-),score=131.46 gnl/MRDRNA2_/MRDRNA2_92449_c0_seq1:92-2347(-)
MPARILHLVIYTAAALRVADEHGNVHEIAEDDELHSPDNFPAIHDESLAIAKLANPHTNSSQNSHTPALLTKMRATLLKKTSEKSEKYHSRVEVQNDTAHDHLDDNRARNISALPIGAASVQFLHDVQHGNQSEFQAVPHQVVLPQMPQPHMLGAVEQSPEMIDVEGEARNMSSVHPIHVIQRPQTLEKEGHPQNQSLAYPLESMKSADVSPRQHEVGKSVAIPPIEFVSTGTWLNKSKLSESETVIESINTKSASNITISFKVDVDVKLGNRTLHTEIDSAVNDTMVEPHIWMPAPLKEQITGPLYGKPFTTDQMVNNSLSVMEDQDDMKFKAKKPPDTLSQRPWHKNKNDSKKVMPLPPRTLYGQGAPGLQGKDSVALVAKAEPVAESHPILWHDPSAKIPEAWQSSVSESQVAPAPGKRASVVRRWNPDDSATKAVSQRAKYYPGHWGSESPAILREPNDDVIRKQVGSEATIWTMLVTMAILLTVLVLLICVMPVKNLCGCRDERQPKSVGEVRRMVESLRITTVEDIESTFKPRGGYDCLLIQPQNPGVVVRVQGVVAASQQATLRAPITRRSCVLFSTSALEHRLDGVVAPPQAFHSMAINFVLDLGPHMKLHIRGQDVALFDMVAGRHEEHVVIREASDLVQDFMRSYRTPFFGARETDFLNFQECILEVGAKVTCVGEVRRSESGELGLWPVHQSMPHGAVSISAPTAGLTSWERLGSPSSGESQVEKVMISDDPQLLRWDAT